MGNTAIDPKWSSSSSDNTKQTKIPVHKASVLKSQ